MKGFNYMGLFTPNFNKPGPGVYKDAPEKHRIWQFFEIFWNQLSKLSLANIIYFFAMLPLALGLMLCFKIDFASPSLIALKTPNQIDLIGFILIIISVFVSFPATLGFTFVLRNIQRREHAWIWHDFIKHIKANYVKGVLNGIIVLVTYFLLFNAFGMYRSKIFNLGIANTFLSSFIVVIGVLFTWMQYYVNTMIVTFDLSLKDIYKNALLFAIGRLPLNILISVIGIIVFILVLMIPSVILYILWFLILYSLFGIITVFMVYPTIDKYMIKANENKEESITDNN